MTVCPPVDCDLRPRDFAARLPRRARGVGARRAARHRGRRLLAVGAALALPAISAAQEWPPAWDRFAIGPATAAGGLVLEPMPFERAGSSFPGSAFYYLAPETAGPLDPDAKWDSGQFDGEQFKGPAAHALHAAGTEVDRMRALTCLTQAIYYEAASEPDGGQRAVAQVVLNRVAHPAYPKSVCGVVYQGSERSTGCQFSFTCDGALARVPNRLFWERAQNVARTALAGFVYTPVGLATHYHTIAIHPYWADSLNYVGTIGAHRFYRFGGPAGAAATFNTAVYRGDEPAAAPRPRTDGPVAPDAALDPVAIERAFAQGSGIASVHVPERSVAGAVPAAPPAPAYAAALAARGGDALYTARALPSANTVRAEYAGSGQWIRQPGSAEPGGPPNH